MAVSVQIHYVRVLSYNIGVVHSWVSESWDHQAVQEDGWQELFFKKNFIYFNWRLITLPYCSDFCQTLTWISHECTSVPHPEPHSHFPPHPVPQGCPSTLALSALFHASNLDWWSISHMVIYTFQCYSLKSSHPRLLPQGPKVCSLYLCLFCYLTYRVIVTIFLNSMCIYINILY